MPLDKEGNIVTPKAKKRDIKDICLIISTAISVFMLVLCIRQNTLNKIQYKEILMKYSPSVNTSYIVCHIDYINALYDALKNEHNSVKILSNDISEMFYDKKTNSYLKNEAFLEKESQLTNIYVQPYTEVIFLKIEIYGERPLYNCTLDYTEILEESNIEYSLRSLKNLEEMNIFNQEKGVFNIGNIGVNDVVLIPVAIRYSDAHTYINEEMRNMPSEMIFRKVYVPDKIKFYDDFLKKETTFPVRDMLENGLITEYFFEELG